MDTRSLVSLAGFLSSCTDRRVLVHDHSVLSQRYLRGTIRQGPPTYTYSRQMVSRLVLLWLHDTIDSHGNMDGDSCAR